MAHLASRLHMSTPTDDGGGRLFRAALFMTEVRQLQIISANKGVRHAQMSLLQRLARANLVGCVSKCTAAQQFRYTVSAACWEGQRGRIRSTRYVLFRGVNCWQTNEANDEKSQAIAFGRREDRLSHSPAPPSSPRPHHISAPLQHALAGVLRLATTQRPKTGGSSGTKEGPEKKSTSLPAAGRFGEGPRGVYLFFFLWFLFLGSTPSSTSVLESTLSSHPACALSNLVLP